MDLADLSALLYLSTYSSEANPADLNQDGNINLADTSILFYYWSEPVSVRLLSFAEWPSFFQSPPNFETSLAKVFNVEGKKRQWRFGIQEENVASTIESAKSAISGFITGFLSLVTAFVSGFLRFLDNIVQLR